MGHPFRHDAVQGMLNLVESSMLTGGLGFVPRSHGWFPSFWKARYKWSALNQVSGQFMSVPSHDVHFIYDLNQRLVLPDLAPGDLVVWWSSTIHRTVPAAAHAPGSRLLQRAGAY